MSLSSLPPDVIDLYLRGELDGITKAAFEQQVTADPVLKADLESQQLLTKGLGITKRRAALKSMLQDTPVPSITGGLWQNTTVQWTAAAVTAAIVVASIWYFSTPVSTPIANQVVATTVSPDQTTPTAPAQGVVAEPTIIEPAIQNSPTEVVVQHAEPTAPKPKASTSQKTDRTAENSPAIFDEPTAITKAPSGAEAIIGVGDNAHTPSVLPKNNAESASSVSETILKTDPAYNLHYQFQEGKLYLYGKFNKGLYEVIDLSGKNGKRSFLFYQDTYYQVLPGTSKITPLEPTADKGVVSSLEKLRKK